PACASGVVCALTSCTGGFNFQCIFGCFGGNIQAALQAFGAFSCLAQNCGQQCVGAIIGGGGGTPPTPGTPPAPPAPAAGGVFGYVSPSESAQYQIPAGPMYLPSFEVLDALPAVQNSCAAYGRSCGAPLK
ncbi:MAG TPA: hypothetical protein PKA88_24665, partial [Polyangiaceae bacterium]|nr:hypothetical protein [Polyangiaceae bacterium]